MKFKDLLKNIEKNKLNVNVDKIKEAYEYAEEKHKNEKRASGDPFIEHPLQTANILINLKMDTNSMVASLLHDVVEDTKDSLENIRKKFGDDVANLVDGVTSLTGMKYREQRDLESLRKMIMATANDIRILIIKLADKLHNMRTIKYLDEDKIKRICQETLDIYAPLSYRLGLVNIKWELEDLAFEQLWPREYEMFREKFGKKDIKRKFEILRLKRDVENELKKRGIKARISGRSKNFYSIYKKMITKNRSFDEIHDLIGLRIINDRVEDCYEILGIIHSKWRYIVGEFKDYIAVPKPNMYQSLHTAVIAYDQPVEFQIRTEDMDKVAEEGIAAHWRYKGLEGDEKFDKKLSWLREILSLQEGEDSQELLERLKIDFFSERIYVFTPKGQVVDLPRGSCPIDFAYAVHSSIGDSCNGAIVNGRIVPLRYQLGNGDIVNILTNKNSNPKRDWLKIIKTVKARSKIRQFFKGKVPVPKKIGEDEIKERRRGAINLERYRLARCCNPIPGDKIVSLETKGKYSVHKENCNRIKNRKINKIDWGEIKDYKIGIKTIGEDRVGLLADLLNTVSATGTNIIDVKSKTMGNNKVESEFSIIAEDLDHIRDLVSRIKRVQSIIKVSVDDKI